MTSPPEVIRNTPTFSSKFQEKEQRLFALRCQTYESNARCTLLRSIIYAVYMRKVAKVNRELSRTMLRERDHEIPQAQLRKD